MKPRHLAITMGDPAGIGPEIIVKACKALGGRIAAGELRLLVIGSGRALGRARLALTPDLDIPEVAADRADWPDLREVARREREMGRRAAERSLALAERRPDRVEGDRSHDRERHGRARG